MTTLGDLTSPPGTATAAALAAIHSGTLGSRTGSLYLPDFYQSGDGSDWLPAFVRAQATLGTDTGAIIQVPVGDFNLSGTFNIWRKLRIVGTGMGLQSSTCSTRLLFPKNVDGLRLWSSQSETGAVAAGVPANGSANTCAIEQIGIFCADGTTTSGIGIHCTAAPRLYRCNVESFGGNGVHIQANAVAEHSNANCWVISDCIIRNNKGYGLYVDGNDANAGVAFMIYAGNNTLGDFWDSSGLGNTYVALQSDASRKVAFTDKGGSVWIGCYNESAGGATDLSASALLLGGVLGNANMPLLSVSGDGTDATCVVVNCDGSGAVTKILPTRYGNGYTTATVSVALQGAGSGLVVTANIVGGHITSYTIVNGGIGYTAGFGTNTGALHAGGTRGGLSTDGAFVVNNYYQSGDRYLTGNLCYNGNQFFSGMIFNNGLNDFEEMHLLDWSEGYKSYFTTLGGRVTARWASSYGSNLTMGRASAIPPGSLVLQDGFWVGGGQTGAFQTDGRYVGNGTAAPTTGQWAKGDIIWNTSPSAGGSMGWMCTTTGDFAGSPTPVFKAMPNLAA